TRRFEIQTSPARQRRARCDEAGPVAGPAAPAVAISLSYIFSAVGGGTRGDQSAGWRDLRSGASADVGRAAQDSAARPRKSNRAGHAPDGPAIGCWHLSSRAVRADRQSLAQRVADGDD